MNMCDKVKAHEASVIRLSRIACMPIRPGYSRPYAGDELQYILVYSELRGHVRLKMFAV